MTDTIVSEKQTPEFYGCSHCGHNLIGLPAGTPCPECDSLSIVNNPANDRCGKAVASLTLGVLSIPSALFLVFGILLGLFALSYARKARKQALAGHAPLISLNIARAGKTLGWIGITLNLLTTAFIAWVFVRFVSNY